MKIKKLKKKPKNEKKTLTGGFANFLLRFNLYYIFRAQTAFNYYSVK